jgi:hypothetical protein
MPLYELLCLKCGRRSRRVLSVKDFKARDNRCRWHGCDGLTSREVQPPTTHNKEVIKQSHQPKDIERFSDVEKLMEERSKKDYRKPD